VADVLPLVDAAVVASAPLAHAVGRVAFVAQLDTRAAVGFVVEGAARGRAADDMHDERTGTRTVHGRRFPRHALDGRARV
jgi:hypothetical protein